MYNATEVIQVKRGLLLSVMLSLALGGWALAQCGCPPSPQPYEPSCYVAFQQCQQIEIGLQVSQGFGFFFCCNPCCPPPEPSVTGWRVEARDGSLVYQQRLQHPVPAGSFSAVWDQRNGVGELVAPGFYNVIVTTDEGEFEKYVKILDRCQFFFPLLRIGSGCCYSACGPEVTLTRYIPPPQPCSCCFPCFPSPCTVSPCCP